MGASELMLMADLTSKTLREFADEVAAGSSAPGGGSVAALAGALGAALGSMVARLTIGKPGYEQAQGEITDALNKLENLRRDMMTLVDEDTTAFNRVTAAYAMTKDTGQAKIERPWTC